MSAKMTTERQQFTGLMRFLHWLMAAMVLTMLGIGVAMVATLGDYHLLLSIHRPLGIGILISVVIRLATRLSSTLPAFPTTMSSPERLAAHASEILLYTLLFVQPLVGWGTHTILAYLFFLAFVAHFGAVLFHTLIARDGLLDRMVPWRVRAR